MENPVVFNNPVFNNPEVATDPVAQVVDFVMQEMQKMQKVQTPDSSQPWRPSLKWQDQFEELINDLNKEQIKTLISGLGEDGERWPVNKGDAQSAQVMSDIEDAEDQKLARWRAVKNYSPDDESNLPPAHPEQATLIGDDMPDAIRYAITTAKKRLEFLQIRDFIRKGTPFLNGQSITQTDLNEGTSN